MKTGIAISVVVLILIAIGIFFSFSSNGGTDSERGSASGETEVSSDDTKDRTDLERLSDISLTDYSGEEVRLSDHSGKLMVVNSWAVWCPFCREELPDFALLQEEFSDDIVVIAIDRAESLRKAKGYTDGLNITDSMVFLLDPRDSFYKAIGGFSMPETIFINTDGTIAFHKRGFMALDEMRARVSEVLNSE